jgi:hypothetical protein
MFPWQDILAGLFGGSVWHIYLAGFHKQGKDMVLSKKEKKSKKKECIIVNL